VIQDCDANACDDKFIISLGLEVRVSRRVFERALNVVRLGQENS
jgi:hypothetical protein